MPAIIQLTPAQPVTVTGPPGPATRQNLWNVVDVSGFDILVLELGIIAFSGPSTPAVKVEIDTSMVNDDDAPWVITPSNSGWTTTLSTSGYYAAARWNKGFLRYIRWNVSTLDATQSITFWIRGIATNYGRP